MQFDVPESEDEDNDAQSEVLHDDVDTETTSR